MQSTFLRAGVGRTDITPPLPADLMGYVRRAEAAREVRMPLTATTLVVADEEAAVAIVCLDLVGLSLSQATELRKAIAAVIGSSPDHVLVNTSHTHAAPHTGVGAGHKLGGDMRTVHDREHAYVEYMTHQIVSSAVLALSRLEPARVGSATGSVDLAVNRRERTGGTEGTAGTVRTILGWNPDGVCDRDVGVLRVDHADGRPLAIVVNYACHPVVVGPEDPAINPDFPGPMRELVENVSGATCLFLQGAGGNVLPLEAFFDRSGPEYRFGRALAIEALHTAWDIDTFDTEIERIAYGSVSPIALYRQRHAADQTLQPLAAAGCDAAIPLKRISSESELDDELTHYRKQLQAARDRGAPPEELNPIDYHVLWAESALEQVRGGTATASVPAYLQALRIGNTLISAVPGEVFSEISEAVKTESPVPRQHSLFAGYSNGVISYLPCASEYAYGGYEVDYAHHSYGLVEQVAPETERVIIDGSLELLRSLCSDES